jgi:hypothetical protein
MKKMMIKMKRTKTIVLIAILLFLCPIADASIGIGIAPVNFTINDAFRGGRYEQTITVFNGGDEPGTFTLAAEGECSDWISFFSEGEPNTPIKELSIPANDRVNVIAMFDIPHDAENRAYTTTIYAQSIQEDVTGEGGAVMGAVVRIPQSVNILVTGTQTLKGIVKMITTADPEVGNPLKIEVEFQNKGNVVAKPKIAFGITEDGTLIDSFVHDESSITPGKTDTIPVLWNTTGNEPGDYSASVSVSLGDETLATKDVPFTILPRGALTRKGILVSLSLEGEPVVNSVIKVLAAFENTGTIDARAKFKGELYREGKLVDVLESDEKLVGAGEKPQLIAYYKITAPGNYKIKGIVCYEGKDTEVKEVSFTALGLEEEEKKPWIPGFEFVPTLIALIIMSAIFGTKSRR